MTATDAGHEIRALSTTVSRIDTPIESTSGHQENLARPRSPDRFVHTNTDGHYPTGSLNTRIAFSRRNFGHTSSLNGTSGMSRNCRSSVRPAGK